jgi:hypothetical protein
VISPLRTYFENIRTKRKTISAYEEPEEDAPSYRLLAAIIPFFCSN